MAQGKRDTFFDGSQKKCTGCLQVKQLSDFSPQKNGKGGRTAKCRLCKNKVNKIYLRKSGKYKGVEEAIGYDGVSKICTLCSRRLELSEFRERDGGPGKRVARCIKCERKWARDRRIAMGLTQYGSNGEKHRQFAQSDVVSKICKICKERKPFLEFYKAAGGIGGVDARCKECSNAIMREKGHFDYDAQKNREKAQTHSSRASRLLKSIKLKSKRQNIPLDIDREWLITRLTNGSCEVTGIKFVLDGAGASRLTHPYSPSIDRIKADRGYLRSNCRLVLRMYNMGKANFDDQTVLEVAQSVVNAKKYKNRNR